jgi:uncharacterized protein YjiS (DUF1127 family)
MNAVAVPAPVASCHHPRLVLPLSITRFVSYLVERWDAWRERRAQRRAFEALARLDPATLRDLGLEDEAAARALARVQSQFDFESCAQRSAIAPW